jgi:hypothetical protein
MVAPIAVAALAAAHAHRRSPRAAWFIRCPVCGRRCFAGLHQHGLHPAERAARIDRASAALFGECPRHQRASG